VQTYLDSLVLTQDAGLAASALRDRLRDLVAQILAANGTHTAFSDDHTLAEVELASLDMVKRMLAVENEFTIEIPQADIAPETFWSVTTVERLVNWLTAAV